MKNAIEKFLAGEQGAETVEWVMIAAVLAAIITTAFVSTGTFRLAVTAAVGRITTALGLV